MNWPTVPIGEIAKQVRGVSYDKSQVSSAPRPGLIPVLRAGNIQDGSLLVGQDLVFVPESFVSLQQLLRPDDIVIAASSGSLDVVGKAAQLQQTWEGSFGAFCKVIRPTSSRVDPRYLHHFFQSSGYRLRVSALAAGANINNLKNEHIDDLEIPLPPLDEQRRIATILDKGEAIKAFFGRREHAFLAVEESLFAALHEGDHRDLAGRSCSLSDVYWFQEGPGVRNWQFTASGVKLLNVGNITIDGRVDLRKTERHVSEDEAFGRYSHFLVDEGDLLMPSSGISIDEDGLLRTRSAFAAGSDLPLCMNTSTIRFKPRIQGASLLFLQGWLQSREFRVQITRLVTGSAQKNFGPSHLKQLSITLPHSDLQGDFEKKLMRIRELRNSLNPSESKLIALLDSLGHLAFNGGASA